MLRLTAPRLLSARMPAARLLLRPQPAALALPRMRALCTSSGSTGKKDGDAIGEKPNEAAASADADAADAGAALEVSREGIAGGGHALMEHEGENLPPLEFEPGAAGVAQKGVSAIVIAFGAAALGAIAWGTYIALFPGASSTGVIYSEAFEKVQQDSKLCNALGTPLRAHGTDHGGGRGRRNTMERWDVEENGENLSVVRFGVAGPQGAGVVQVQTPRNRSRGEFKYIIFEAPHPRGRMIYHVYDGRNGGAGDAPAAAAEPPAPLTRAPSGVPKVDEVPPPPPPLAPAKA